MSPFQHGEVFVTEDGAETDLDLGHYERFVRTTTGRNSNFTTGRIYDSVIAKERRGDYLGAHRAGHSAYYRRDQALRPTLGAGDADVCMVEIGGTVGDIESLPFLEAIRQMGVDLGPRPGGLCAPDAGAVHRHVRARSRPSRPSTRSRNCAPSAFSRTCWCAVPIIRCPMNSAARSRCSPTCRSAR